MTTTARTTPAPLSPIPSTADWAHPLSAIVAKGLTAARPGSLGGLAAARAEHQGQFFTPDAVAARLWQIAQPTMATLAGVRRVSLLDTSIGSARLLQFADPATATVSGCDPDERAVGGVVDAMMRAGVEGDVIAAGLELCHPTGFDVALLNPPFSLTLQSPHIVAGASTSYGPFGPDTSALSQWYALEQALRAAAVVVVLLPLQDVERLMRDASELLGEAGARLTHAYRLPAGSFRSEGTNVATAIALFGPEAPSQAPTWHTLPAEPSALAVPAEVPVFALPERAPQAHLRAVTFDAATPIITAPVTGDPRAVLHHDGRRLVVTTSCGFTEARLRNALSGNLVAAPENKDVRLPRGVKTTGHFRLDREFLLAQPDWRSALNELQRLAREVDVELEISSTLANHLPRRARLTAQQAAPFGRIVKDDAGLLRQETPARDGVTTRALLSDPTQWAAPSIPKGTAVSVRASGPDAFLVTSAATSFTITEAQLQAGIRLAGAAPVASATEETDPASTGWSVVAPPLSELTATAGSVAAWRARAIAAGVDQWLWDFQFEDVPDLLAKPHGAVAGWHTGLGKARLAAALALVHGGKRTVVVVPARLVPEIETEWRSLPLPDGWWQVVRKPNDIDWNVPVLLIAAEHLRAPVAPGARRTLATVLRRRASLLVVDEADFLANPLSAQSRAVWTLSARRNILLTATPVANYPRDVFPLLALAGGDGTAGQPYGWHRAKCAPAAWRASQLSRAGRDAIREEFMTTVWVTPEFTDTMREGAKREIPVIQNLAAYRAALAPVIKRRVHGEPAVARFVKVPHPVWDDVRPIEWDAAHFAHFLRVADEFAEWYRKHRDACGDKQSSLVTLLARIGAVERAANDPMHARLGPAGHYGHPTSKQRAVVAHLVQLAADGHKALCYGRHPQTLDWMARALAAAGVRSVVLHGGRSILVRIEELNTQFRDGTAPVVLASFGTGDRGLNLPQASRVVLLDRDWSARTERQCIGRVLRPQQREIPRVQPFHLPGSLDDYMAQLTRFKADAADAGVDWGTPLMRVEDFLHLDTVIGAFVESLATLRGQTQAEFRAALRYGGALAARATA